MTYFARESARSTGARNMSEPMSGLRFSSMSTAWAYPSVGLWSLLRAAWAASPQHPSDALSRFDQRSLISCCSRRRAGAHWQAISTSSGEGDLEVRRSGPTELVVDVVADRHVLLVGLVDR